MFMQGRKNHCVAVIGDGAITGGMAYEAMNHAGFLDKNMIVVLNDNQQVCPACTSLPTSLTTDHPAVPCCAFMELALALIEASWLQTCP